LPVTLSNGSSILEGLTVSNFTREEEIDYGAIDKIPHLEEEKLACKAARFTKVSPRGENVIEQGCIITGQNLVSTAGVGKAIVKRVQQTKVKAA